MIGCRVKSVTSVLLAALLAVCAIAPSAIRHVHPMMDGGPVHHRHDGGQGLVDGHHHHADGHTDHRICPESRLLDMVGGQMWHLHIQFLAFELTLPDPPSDEDDDDSSRGVGCVMLWSAPYAPAFGSMVSWHVKHVVTHPVVPGLRDATSMQAVVLFEPRILSAPLCDRARQERSGVLLA